MGTIRLGKRTEDRVPLIRDFVPLAGIDQLVFGAWDPISDTAYEAALKCGVLDRYTHIEPIAAAHSCDRMVVIWCASTEIFLEPGPAHQDLAALEAAMDASDPSVPPSMLYAYAALKEGVPFINGAPNLTVDVPAMVELALSAGAPIGGKDFKSGQTLMKT